ncbi:MAG TPA: hypothetical protein VMR81_07475 [Patescibacteria group bacterium]|jgi:hypothetical protein|nr:hypothetical protein [Patescibacteria group bacterium]
MHEKDSNHEPHVEIFGDTYDHERHHHRDSGRPVAGVMFLFAGIILLLNTAGVVPWVVWHTIGQFWPVIFIFMGLQILLGSSVLADAILFFLAVFVFGIVFIFSLQSVGSSIASTFVLPKEITTILETLRRYIK